MEPRETPKAVSSAVRDSWDRCAETYVDGFGALVSESIDPLLDRAAVQSGSAVLDMGTGPGIVAAAAHDRQATAVGIDFSTSMVAEAKRRYPDIEFRCADAASLPFDAGSFDAVVSNFVFHILARPDQALAEAYRVLRDGGKIAFTVWSDLSKLAGFGLFLDAMNEHVEAQESLHGPLFGVSDFEAFREIVQAAGFRDTSVTSMDIVWKISSIDSYLNVFRAWANLGALPDNTRAAIEDSVRKAATELESKGTLSLANPAILVSATK